MSISIIIPVLNEQEAVSACLDKLFLQNRLGEQSGLEILVVDGGSTDKTLKEVIARGLTPIASASGRGIQQHAGAQSTTGDILLFLHCDTALPENFADYVRETVRQKNVAAGAFRLAINGTGAGLRLIEAGANLRSICLGFPYGDQALFMRRKTYFVAGGFPEEPIMEDVALVRRLKKIGKIVLAPASVTTSARRWQQHGLIKTTLINQLMLLGRAGGISSQQLAQWYYKKRK